MNTWLASSYDGHSSAREDWLVLGAVPEVAKALPEATVADLKRLASAEEVEKWLDREKPSKNQPKPSQKPAKTYDPHLISIDVPLGRSLFKALRLLSEHTWQGLIFAEPLKVEDPTLEGQGLRFRSDFRWFRARWQPGGAAAPRARPCDEAHEALAAHAGRAERLGCRGPGPAGRRPLGLREVPKAGAAPRAGEEHRRGYRGAVGGGRRLRALPKGLKGLKRRLFGGFRWPAKELKGLDFATDEAAFAAEAEIAYIEGRRCTPRLRQTAVPASSTKLAPGSHLISCSQLGKRLMARSQVAVSVASGSPLRRSLYSSLSTP